MKVNKNIEILAPAGNLDSLYAAVCAGADAVYLGLDHFNARRGADNFKIENLKEICDYAHLRGVKIYLTLNIIVFENEFNEAMQLAYAASDAGVDAFIVQDIGLANTISREIPDVSLHISTQMNIHDEDGFRAVAELGAKRVCLARECSLEMISKLSQIGEELGVEVETFGHGALCICFSGQCLMSSMIGGRSANRGMCAQPCRLNYELKKGKWELCKRRNSADDKRGSYLLSPKDLCTIEILPKLINAGVDSIKIEGRMKSPEYVYEVVSVYREAINRIQNEGIENYSVTQNELKRLSEAFSRGFSTAYMEGQRGNEIMSYSRPNNRGLNIGRVSGISSKNIWIDIKHKLNIGDVLEIWTRHGRSTLTVDKNTKINEKQAVFTINSQDFRLKNVAKSDRVFRVRSAANKFNVNFFEPRIEIDCAIDMHIGKPLRLRVSGRGKTVYVEGDIVETAKTKAITKTEVIAHIDRLGQTPFLLNSCEVSLDENVGIGFSHLHHIRQKATDLLIFEITKNNRNILGKRNEKKRVKNNFGKHNVHVVDSKDIFKSNEFCDNLGKYFRNLENGETVFIGPHIPVVNIESVYYFKKKGVKKFWLSPELTIDQIKLITSSFPELEFGLYIIGPTELMMSKHCFLMSEGECSQECDKCSRRKNNYYLLDRMGYEFPVITDCDGISHIYNSVSLDICHAIPNLIEYGVKYFLVDTTLFTNEEASLAVARAKTALTNNVDKIPNTTTGHLFRQVL